MESYKTLCQEARAEIEEKKSKFIAIIRPIKSVEEMADFVGEIKKKYWDARHHCQAYILGKRQEVVRFSDDKEPGGTAGKPMLDVLLGAGLCDVGAIVIRYFGGVLLGTGGLVRAYSKAVAEAIKEADILEKKVGCLQMIETDYVGLGKIQYIAGKNEAFIVDTEYTDQVKIKILVPKERVTKLLKDVTEATSGQALIDEGKDFYYSLIQGSVRLYEN